MSLVRFSNMVLDGSYVSIVEVFLEEHSLTDSTSNPSQPKRKKVVKDVSDMTEEEQLEAAMLASANEGSSTSTGPSTTIPAAENPPSYEDVEDGNNQVPYVNKNGAASMTSCTDLQRLMILARIRACS